MFLTVLSMSLQVHLKIMYYHPKNTDIHTKFFSLFCLYVIAGAPKDYVLPPQEHRHRHKCFSLFYLYVIGGAPKDYVLPTQEHRHRHKVFLFVCHCRSI